MPTLQFKGKNIIWNHHLSVPYHTLEEVEELSFQPEKSNGNIIVEGDNLLALKALLPQYAGKIKCIYIDPPYNTGNEGWIYNDKVNSPLINDWLGKTVGTDDLTRHDKWLCMMAPRLKLIYELLTEDGLFISSIDDNEFESLRYLLGEIFGLGKHLATFVWRRRVSSSMAASWISTDHEYLLMFSKNPDQVWVKGEDRDMSKYSIDDSQGKKYASMPLTVGMNKEMRPNQWYELKNPKTGKGYWPPKNRVWGYYPPTMNQKIENGFIIWPEDYPDRKMTTPRLKSYPEAAKRERKPLSTWIYELNTEVDNLYSFFIKTGKNEEGTRAIKDIFTEETFSYAKPISLIKLLIDQFTKDQDLILDSFAGSGTTMHAVMELNKEDGGNRQCIMVQMPENTPGKPDKNICKEITRERVKRAIEKYGYDSGFKYLRVGIPIDPESMLAGTLPTFNQLAEYVYYLASGENLKEKDQINPEKGFVGNFGKHAIYLVYKQDYEQLTKMALNLQKAEQIHELSPGMRKIVYAPACFLDEEYMQNRQIEYVSIPYNLFQRR